MKQTFKDFLINEGRSSPRGMNYSFDEIDPAVDKNSFRDSNRARRQAERDEERSGSALNSADGRNPRHHMSNSEMAADREWEAEQRSERQAMHGTEEEVEQIQKQRHPASSDKQKVYQGKRERGGARWNAYPSTKRQGQQAARSLRSLQGSGNSKGMQHGEEEMEARMPAIRDKISGVDFQARDNDKANQSRPSVKRRGQRAERNLRRRSGLGNPSSNAKGFGFNESNYPDDMSQYDNDPRSPNYDDGGYDDWADSRVAEFKSDISELNEEAAIKEVMVEQILDGWQIGNQEAQHAVINNIDGYIDQVAGERLEYEWQNR